MGMTRKFLSSTTLGLVDFRSDKERTAAYTKGTRRQARKQTAILRDIRDDQRGDVHAERVEAVGDRAEKIGNGLASFGARMQAKADALEAKRKAK